MNEKLEQVEKRYEQLQAKVADPNIVSDMATYRDTMKALSEIEEVVTKYRQLKHVRKSIADTRDMLATIKGEDDLRELAALELAELQTREPVLENDLRLLLQPRDPNDEKNVFVEIRAGTGGDEASLFASEIMRMSLSLATSLLRLPPASVSFIYSLP